jgi:hypothetical protein
MSENTKAKIPMISIAHQEALRWLKRRGVGVPMNEFNEDKQTRRPTISTIKSLEAIGLIAITDETVGCEADGFQTAKTVELSSLGKKMSHHV